MIARFVFRLAVITATTMFVMVAAPCFANGRLPEEEAFLSMFGRAKPDNRPPFELPELLPGGGVKMFHRSASKNTYDYSQGGRVHVYRYDQADIAAEDFMVFSKSNERLDEKTSATLAKQGACVTRQKDSVTLWVLLDESIAGFELPRDKWSAGETAKTAEALVKAEEERTAKAFGEPERVVNTFIKAVEKVDESQIMRALTSGGDDAVRKRMEQIRGMLPMLRIAMMERMGEMLGGRQDPASRQPRVGKAEKTAEGRFFVPVRAENADPDQPWLGLLIAATGKEKLVQAGQILRRADQLWIPVTKIGNRWAIDVSTLGRSLFSKTEQEKQDRDCFTNLRQLLLALKAAANDDPDEMKFPAKLSFLFEQEYVTDLKFFTAPNSPNKTLKEGEIDEKTDYILEGAGKEDEDDGDFIVIYDKPNVHDGKGRHVGFADGHVQWLAEDEFKRLLAAQRKDQRPARPREKPVPMPPPMPGEETIPAEPVQPLPMPVPPQRRAP